MATTGSPRMGARKDRRIVFSQGSEISVLCYLDRLRNSKEGGPASVAEISREVIGLQEEADANAALKALVSKGVVTVEMAPGDIATYRLKDGVVVESIIARILNVET